MESIIPNNNNQKVSLIVPAKNEEKTIRNVLSATVKHPLIDEVIAVVNGSTDKTAEIVENEFPSVILINDANLKGKTLAVKKGFSKAKNDIILMLDSDLVGITEEDVTKLLLPILEGKADCTMSVRGNSIWPFKLLRSEFITGERALRREIFEDPFIWSKPEIGYSLEVLMNKVLLERKQKLCTVYLPNVKITYKAKKTGLIDGLNREINMWFFQMPKAIGAVNMIKQIIKMSFPITYNDLYEK